MFCVQSWLCDVVGAVVCGVVFMCVTMWFGALDASLWQLALMVVVGGVGVVTCVRIVCFVVLMCVVCCWHCDCVYVMYVCVVV